MHSGPLQQLTKLQGRGRQGGRVARSLRRLPLCSIPLGLIRLGQGSAGPAPGTWSFHNDGRQYRHRSPRPSPTPTSTSLLSISPRPGPPQVALVLTAPSCLPSFLPSTLLPHPPPPAEPGSPAPFPAPAHCRSPHSPSSRMVPANQPDLAGPCVPSRGKERTTSPAMVQKELPSRWGKKTHLHKTVKHQA